MLSPIHCKIKQTSLTLHSKLPPVILDIPQFHSYSETVKNITLSVEDDVYQSARVEAAKQQTSLSAVVRNYLRLFASGRAPSVMDDNTEDRKNREKLVKLLSGCKLELGYKPSREKTYEGNRFSRL